MALLAARDLRSSLGSNLALVREVSGLNPWVAGRPHLWAALEAAAADKFEAEAPKIPIPERVA